MEGTIITQEFLDSLKEGDKIEFKWHGNKELLYVGRIEVDKLNDVKYWVPEHCYENDVLVQEQMKYYNEMKSFFSLTYFKKLC